MVLGGNVKILIGTIIDIFVIVWILMRIYESTQREEDIKIASVIINTLSFLLGIVLQLFFYHILFSQTIKNGIYINIESFMKDTFKIYYEKIPYHMLTTIFIKGICYMLVVMLIKMVLSSIFKSKKLLDHIIASKTVLKVVSVLQSFLVCTVTIWICMFILYIFRFNTFISTIYDLTMTSTVVAQFQQWNLIFLIL